MSLLKQYGQRLLISMAALLLLQACGGSSSTRGAATESSEAISGSEPAQIYVNQVGYQTTGSKPIWIKSAVAQKYQILDAQVKVVSSGMTAEPQIWQPAEQALTRLELPALELAGDYLIRLDNGAEMSISVVNSPWSDLHDAALRSYYLNRSGIEILALYAGPFMRELGHPDTRVTIHSSAASDARPTGSVISASKGWYDAGDYNKYVVNSGISTYSLLLSYQHFAPFYKNRRVNIPESVGALPDILAEIKWNLDWLQAMQDPNDGGVYHKLTSLNFNPMEMPSLDDDVRYVVQKTTAATLNFAAVMATAARIYREFDSTLADVYQTQAISAFAWAKQNPTAYYQQPSDVSTGEYGDDNVADEFFWAAIELFITTGEEKYWQAANSYGGNFSVPSWSRTESLGLYSLLSSERFSALNLEHQTSKENALLQLANSLVAQAGAANAMGLPMTSASDFVWGSNAVAMNQAMVLLNANRIKPDANYWRVAENLLHYILGTNPTSYSYVTGFGTKTPMHVHHRISEADGIVAPFPGMLAGGPQPQQQDKCEGYPSNALALSFLDDVCSYSTNEIAINWNAPFVYVLAQFNSAH